MKVKDIVADAATVAGVLVGAGFLSGKEAAIYYGNATCVIIFVAVFCILTLVVRNFAYKNGCRDVGALCRASCGKLGVGMSAMASCCCFVCVIAILAGAESCLSSLLLPGFDAFYGLIIGFCGVLVVKRGLSALKVMNIISLAVTASYLVWLAVETGGNQFVPLDTPLYAPVVYAVFSATMALGVLTKLASNAKTNVIATVLSAVFLVALAMGVLRLCNFNLSLPLMSVTKNSALNALGGVAILLCTVTGVSTNAIPVVECVKDVFDGDETLCLLVIFAVATAFSLLGVDMIMKFGYLLVAGVGAVIVVGCVIKGKAVKHTVRKRKKESK